MFAQYGSDVSCVCTMSVVSVGILMYQIMSCELQGLLKCSVYCVL